MTIEKLIQWIKRDLSSFGQPDRHIKIIENSRVGDCAILEFEIYTQTNCYHILAEEIGDKTYLRCGSSSRKPRAGEGWARGRDLPDGELTEETWHKILSAIVSYEMVAVVNDGRSLDDPPENQIEPEKNEAD